MMTYLEQEQLDLLALVVRVDTLMNDVQFAQTRLRRLDPSWTVNDLQKEVYPCRRDDLISSLDEALVYLDSVRIWILEVAEDLTLEEEDD